MDLLDRVLAPGLDLLRRVDDSLTAHGAPTTHPVWPLLRRLGLLPADVLTAFVALAPHEMAASAARIAASGPAVRETVADVPTPAASSGAAAEHFRAAWSDLARQAADEPGDLAERLSATGTYLSSLADWASSARHELAIEVGACLGSAEALLIRAGVPTRDATATGRPPDTGAITAAADVAARVLTVAGASIERGWQLHAAGRTLAVATPFRAYAGTATLESDRIDLR